MLRNKKNIVIITSAILLFLMISTLASCAPLDTKDGNGLEIVCTTFPQYDFIRNITGTEENLYLLLDDGTDMHNYEPRADDIALIASCDMLVYVGGTSDKWIDGVIEASGNRDMVAFSMLGAVEAYEEETVEGMEAEAEDEVELDEHVWLSIKNAKEIVLSLCDKICALDPANLDVYNGNALRYVAKLNEVDSDYTAAVQTAARKTLVFADRFPFRYMIEDYGLEYYAAFPGCSTEQNASAQTKVFLIEKVKSEKIPAVLTIDGASDDMIKFADSICAETGAKRLVINSLQKVTRDDITGGINYIDTMVNNLKTITEALN